MVVALLLSAAIAVFLDSFLRKMEASAEDACLASIGVALPSLTAEETEWLLPIDSEWEILSKNKADDLLKIVKAHFSIDCVHGLSYKLFGRRYRPPRIAIRRIEGVLEYAIWSKSVAGIFNRETEVIVHPRGFELPPKFLECSEQ